MYETFFPSLCGIVFISHMSHNFRGKRDGKLAAAAKESKISGGFSESVEQPLDMGVSQAGNSLSQPMSNISSSSGFFSGSETDEKELAGESRVLIFKKMWSLV